MSDMHFLYDITEDTKTRFISFIGDNSRFDLAIITTNNYFGKKLVLDIQSGKFAIIGSDDLDEPGYLEFAFGYSEETAEELKDFLLQII
jgi:hypothetical protein